MTDQVIGASCPAGGSPLARFVRRGLATGDGVGPLVLRLTLALVMFPHGLQKTFGAFGGYGWSGTMGFLTGMVGLPTAVAALVILIEFLGPIVLLLGAATRLAALGFISVMIGAIVTTHAPNGFFMNWAGTQKGEGFEYHLLAIGIALALLVGGAGRGSLDRALTRRCAATK